MLTGLVMWLQPSQIIFCWQEPCEKADSDEPFIWKSGWPHLIVMQPVPASSWAAGRKLEWEPRVRSFDSPLWDFAPLTWISNMSGKEFILTGVSIFQILSEAGLLVGSTLSSMCSFWGDPCSYLWDAIMKVSLLRFLWWRNGMMFESLSVTLSWRNRWAPSWV